MPLILPGNVASATASTGYDVANSCRFNDGDSASMTKTSGSGDRRQFTISAWVKRGVLGTEQEIYGSGDSGSNVFGVFFDGSTNRLSVTDYQSGGTLTLTTNRVFRDCSAWYHVCVAIDTEQATNTNRVKIYINGTQETSFATANYPDEDEDLYVNVSGQPHNVGVDQGPGRFFDGYMAEVVFIDGTQYAASDFGEFDSDSPTIWKPKDPSGLTFGTNGFYLDFEASDNLGNDANGGTDLTESNLAATDQATDTPTNNFATMNPLDNYYESATFSEGNCKIVGSGSNYSAKTCTFGVSKGKWYYEAKCAAVSAASIEAMLGLIETIATSTTFFTGTSANSVGFYKGGSYYKGGSSSAYGSVWGANDILSIAFDLDNNAIYIAINGTWQNSADPAAGSGGISLGTPSSGFYYPSTTEGTFEMNFGGCSGFTVSSGNADADGYGNFEYAVPSGYFALCTKNLAEYG
jgi:hypothetical protein